MELMEFLQQEEQKALVCACESITEYSQKANRLGKYYADEYTYFAKCFWTVKCHPNQYHSRGLRYPKLTKLSDFVENVKYQITKPQENLAGIYIHQSHRGSKFGDVLDFEIEKEAQGKHFVTAHCKMKDGIDADVLERVGSIELIDREEGLIVIAQSSTHIGSDWLGIVKVFDVPVKSAIIESIV